MTLVVGYSPARGDRSPLDLGATLARSIGTDLLAVAVVPAPWPTPVAGGTDREFAAWSRAEGERAVEEVRAFLDDGADPPPTRVVAVPGRSAAGTLVEQVKQTDAAMVVVGSAEHGMVGRVVLGSTASRLLYSSPIPVAVAPRGFRAPSGGRVTRATCSFRTDAASQSALEQTAQLCRATGAALRVATFGVLGATMYPPEVLGEKQVLATFAEETGKAQAAAVAALPGGGEGVVTAVVTGRDWPEVLGRLEWRDGDVLVLGSSSTGLLSQVFIGTNATRIVRHSPVPAIVVPH
jgi:nucleotide-binding universal stress UspA family protein